MSTEKTFDFLANQAEKNGDVLLFRTITTNGRSFLRVNNPNKHVELIIPVETNEDMQFVNELLEIHDNCPHQDH